MKLCPHCHMPIIAKPARCDDCGAAICGTKRLRFCSATCRSRARRRRENEVTVRNQPTSIDVLHTPPRLSLPTNHDDFAIGRWIGVNDDLVATGVLYPPRRIQRKRTKGWRMPTNTVYVGRGSIWGNPFKEGEHWRHGALRVTTGNVAFSTQLLKAFGDRKMTREDCVTAYRIYLDYAGIPAGEGRWPEPKDLRGRNLACWCGEGACHADVLLERANKYDNPLKER